MEMRYYLDQKKNGIYRPVTEEGTNRLKIFKFKMAVCQYVRAHPFGTFVMGRLTTKSDACRI